MDRVGEVSVAERGPQFNAEFLERLCDLLKWRRDVRRFKRTKLPEGTIERLIATACLAPSVGLSEPCRDGADQRAQEERQDGRDADQPERPRHGLTDQPGHRGAQGGPDGDTPLAGDHIPQIVDVLLENFQRVNY